MENFSIRDIIRTEKENKELILTCNPNVSDTSGIYILIREENGFKYAYIGQSKKMLTRLAGHLKGYQHIDKSLKTHGFYSEENKTGWKIGCLNFKENELDFQEQKYIKKYADAGYQLRNKTSGSQGEEKKSIVDNITKGYIEGLHNGYKKAQKEIAHLFNLHLDYLIKGKSTKIKEKALLKFKNFLNNEVE